MSELKTTPTPGHQYKVVRGDRLDNIEKIAYGYITGAIEGANPQLATRKISLENRPTIYSGDVLNIPVLPSRSDLKNKNITGKKQNDLTLIIGGKEIKYNSARVIRTMDTAADGWVASVPWTPGLDPEFDSLVIPFSYPQAQVYIGNTLLINGLLYSVSPEQSKEGLALTLEGFSYTADLIDSTMPKPYEANNITLEDRTEQLIRHIGIKAIFEFPGGGKFSRVTADRDDTIFSHLQSLAGQRGLLLSSTTEGNLLFTKTKNEKPVGTIQSGDPLPIEWGAKFDGRALYNAITAYGESPGSPVKNATVLDPNVPRSRFMSFSADETTPGDIQKAAEWRRAKLNAACLEIPFPVSGWYAPDGSLWRENTQVIVKSKEIFVPNGFTFLIREVEYVIEKSGITATLSLVPPSVYTGEKMVLPWEAQ